MIDPSVLQIHLEQGALDKPLCTKPSAVYGERKDIFTPAEVRNMLTRDRGHYLWVDYQMAVQMKEKYQAIVRG